MMACLQSLSILVQFLSLLLGLKVASVYTAEELSFDDSQGFGRTFDGIGAISGGGATSKLLVNYPKKQRDEILDFLYKPIFGASLQIFKVEIGGDMQSTDGTEASHMHTSWDENYRRGYEWWMMKEVKKRNPDVKLCGLPWGFPGWLGKGSKDPYVNATATADYVVRWVNGAKVYHNLTIDYIGIWNERPYNVDYIKTLRSMLDNRGYAHVKIVASDNFGWKIVKDMKKDPDLAKSIDVVGAHYPGTKSSQDAKDLGKTLWASEDYNTFNDNVGAGCLARIINRNYAYGLMTSTIAWNLITSYYRSLTYPRSGLMDANQPWSGNYVVQNPIWISAHTTQFTSIGWKYLKHGKGVGNLTHGGSYVSFVSPVNKTDFTIVIETMTHNHSICVRPNVPQYDVQNQEIIITLKGSFASIGQMNVWYTRLGFDGGNTTVFEKRSPIKFEKGQARLSLKPDEIYTLTTSQGGQKGFYPPPPPPKSFPLPYHDDFESYRENQEPYNIAPQMGSFEVIKGRRSNILRQTVTQRPVFWCGAELDGKALSVIGDHDWSEIKAQVDFAFPDVNATDGIFLAGRVDRGGCHNIDKTQGFFFFVFNGKFIVANDLMRRKVLAQGFLSPMTGWHTLHLSINATTVSGYVDKILMFEIPTPSKPANGWVGIGTDSFGLADFDNIEISTVK